MSNASFRARIRQSIENETLQTALDNNSERRLRGKATAFESIPDWRERRQRAHSVRADVVERLDEYLDRFIANAQTNGITIHRAKDAQEAIHIVLDITQSITNYQSPSPLIAKSKSMVSEEISLNHALEEHGIDVVETDLGEYIVQLRKERPSHIITPAAHLKKEQVAQLFHEKLGIPYTEDIPTLTATARKVLRQVFLTADIGISGVNFGVAETGGICIVTNEGNGRMVTTLPKTHIALMGIERLVPNLDDLALMLSLLPRSATGQKITVYTQLIHTPMPGQERHIILLDNGRNKIRNSPLKESLYCIRCGACLNACPVFRELSGHAYIGRDLSIAPYPGPIGSVISPGLFGENYFQLAQASSLCGACKEACPVDIDLPKLLTRVRAGAADDAKRKADEDGKGLTWSTRFFLRIFTRLSTQPKLFALSQKLASLGTHLLSPRSAWMRLPAFTGWGYSKDLPRFAGKTFRERFKPKTPATSGDVALHNPDSNVSRRWNAASEGAALHNPDSNVSRRWNAASGDVALREYLVQQFTGELAALSGNVYRTQNPTRAVAEYLLANHVLKIYLQPGVLDETQLTDTGIDYTHDPDPTLTVGVTKAWAGLADTGSVLEADGELFGSLLPEVHLVILKSKDILPSLPDSMSLVKNQNAVFITGPSRTADIEMTLTIGVHGPREIHVFVDDSNSG
ncbi:MAG: LUD domain-containing protein [Anaerolineales bacterium]|jgi:L-lactate dehydrogenase complex protein LldF|nr:LUD domain-containing protein [Anaerolineales bacterium]MCC6985115.1 LUD domain-containing protein [Anaerolineales bacterium]